MCLMEVYLCGFLLNHLNLYEVYNFWPKPVHVNFYFFIFKRFSICFPISFRVKVFMSLHLNNNMLSYKAFLCTHLCCIILIMREIPIWLQKNKLDKSFFFTICFIVSPGSCSSSRLCGLEKSWFLGTDCVYFALLFLITCSMSACSDVSSLMSYLARIFMMGRIFSHHCVLGMRCLQPREEGQLLRELKLKHFGARWVLRDNGGGWEGGWGFLLKICICLQLSKRLEGQRPLPHAQHTGGVRCVGKDAT